MLNFSYTEQVYHEAVTVTVASLHQLILEPGLQSDGEELTERIDM